MCAETKQLGIEEFGRIYIYARGTAVRISVRSDFGTSAVATALPTLSRGDKWGGSISRWGRNQLENRRSARKSERRGTWITRKGSRRVGYENFNSSRDGSILKLRRRSERAWIFFFASIYDNRHAKRFDTIVIIDCSPLGNNRRRNGENRYESCETRTHFKAADCSILIDICTYYAYLFGE